ncbi:DNA-directed RNA polymerase [Candidatus Woesearchaeota archaeon CG11_big_fil_rev_8_21_14_0_20_43_8]|nr:MAG: DNA-directed RNA polymerase [Candidatus Woesearchaeota archaeon CG11_big_fil_rev_8_21_14_0_20_43_8]PIO04716.1 MAG: DNA-directed RNA polymerase [Candidatus Woesearchaeota archaeon CG08_land_8_20_14_0_20_43_7]
MREDNDRRGNRGGFNNRSGGRDGGHSGGFGGGRGGGFNSGPREMHKAICAECNKECEVPFKPTEGKPVYCRDCFQKHRR